MADDLEPRLPRGVVALLAYLLDCQERACASGAAPPASKGIARVLQIMESRLAERWTVGALAKAAGLSRAAFARRFLAEVGVPPMRYLTELRMARATRLLGESDDALASIAAQIGYDSEFAFSRAFKRHTGQAPSVLRRRLRAGGPVQRPALIRAASGSSSRAAA